MPQATETKYSLYHVLEYATAFSYVSLFNRNWSVLPFDAVCPVLCARSDSAGSPCNASAPDLAACLASALPPAREGPQPASANKPAHTAVRSLCQPRRPLTASPLRISPRLRYT